MTSLANFRPAFQSAGRSQTTSPRNGGTHPDMADATGGRRGTDGGASRPFFSLVAPGVNAAISRGLFRQVRFLAQFGADVNERDENGRTPLAHCALVDSEPWAVGLARLLVEKGASVGLRDRHGLNALHYAAIYDRQGLVDVFLGAVDFDLNQRDKLGNTALHYAVSVGNVTVVQNLVTTMRRYDLSVDTVNKKGATPLIQAYKCGHAQCADVLLSHGADATYSQSYRVDVPTALETRNQRRAQHEGKARAATAASNQSTPGASARVRVLVTPPSSTSGQRRQVSRPMSARVMAVTQRLTSGQRPSSRQLARRHGSGRDEDVESDPETEILNQAKNLDRMYRAASISELRNRPEVVFNMDPIECLVQGTSSHPQIPRKGVPPVSSQASPARGPASWRCDVKKLYGAFEFQFTPSFVAGVKPLPPEPEPSSEDSSSLRPSSALASESMSGSMSDIASICSKRSSGRRMSTANALEGKGRRVPPNPGSKRRQLQALLTLRGDSDASSTDTGSVSSGSARRRKDSSDAESNGSTRKNGKGRLGTLIEPLMAVKGSIKSSSQTT